MTSYRRIVLTASQAAVASLTLACAHAAPAGEPATGSQPATAPPQAVAVAPRLVTGSHIPQRVDPCAGLPATTDNLRIYCRERILQTGKDGDLGAALRELDPSLSTRW